MYILTVCVMSVHEYVCDSFHCFCLNEVYIHDFLKI